LPILERELGSARSLVQGETDSERVFALITREVDRNGSDVSAGIVTAARWIASELSVFALNVVLTTPADLWALRYPDTHDLFGARAPGRRSHEGRHFEGASAAGRIRVRSADLAVVPAVVVASERMDENRAWRKLEPGELVHVDENGNVHAEVVLKEPPAKPLHLKVPPPLTAPREADS
jgi:predicted glutamine amidotransferase